MTAADDHSHTGKNIAPARDSARVNMSVQMIDRDQRFVQRQTQRLGGDQANQQRTGQTGRVGYGDRIKIDVPTLSLDLLVDEDELARRRSEWAGAPEPRYTTGVLAKYARLAQGAEKGAITNVT